LLDADWFARVHGRNEEAEFLHRTRRCTSPLDYVQELTAREARFWLTNEKLRRFPVDAALARERAAAGASEACHVVARSYVWSRQTNSAFPLSCRRLAAELACIRWPIPFHLVADWILPYVMDRMASVRWRAKQAQAHRRLEVQGRQAWCVRRTAPPRARGLS
jgi:hypothetical protein